VDSERFAGLAGLDSRHEREYDLDFGTPETNG
jgi:hypothetical protein